MDNAYIKMIERIVADFGEKVLEDIRLFKAVSNDLAPKMKRESIQIFNLIELGAYARLKRSGNDRELIKNSLFRQLVEDYSVNETAAKWAVEVMSAIAGERGSFLWVPYISPGATMPAFPAPGDTENTQKPAPVEPDFTGMYFSFGPGHFAFIRRDGTLGAYGDNSAGQCNVSGEGYGISAGAAHTAALRKDGKVEAWGSDEWGQCRVQGHLGIIQVACGDFHTALLKNNGTVVVLGGMEKGLFKDCAKWENIVFLSCGGSLAAGVDIHGSVWVAGDDPFGEIDVSGLKGILKLSMGRFHLPAVKRNGLVSAAGDNEFGQCNVSGLSDIDIISAGLFHTAAVNSYGRVFALGDNKNGQLKVSDFAAARSVYAGDTYTLAINKKGGYDLAGEFPLWLQFYEDLKKGSVI